MTEYPRILPDLRVAFRIKAPDAQKVEFDLGKHYAATKASPQAAINAFSVPALCVLALKVLCVGMKWVLSRGVSIFY